MARVFLTTLGTNRYIECHYSIENNLSKLVPFVQEALLAHYKPQFTSDDRILVFCTDEAERRNWLDQSPENPEGNFCKGLKSRIEDVKLNAGLEMKKIPEGSNESQIMEIFTIITDSLRSDDQVILDITHSFRSLPLLNAVILNYAKVLKNIKVLAIHYGAFEVLGTPAAVLEMPEGERIAPVFNLTPYDRLLDWAIAVDDFVRLGLHDNLYRLVHEDIKPILAQTRGADETADGLRRLIKELESLCKNILTVRGPEIEQKGSLRPLVEELKGQDLIRPLNPLLDKIGEKSERFAVSDPLDKGFQAVEWCIEHHLVPQGYTLLRETIITGLCRLAGHDFKSETLRERFWAGFLRVLARGKDESEWYGELAERKDEARRFMEEWGDPLKRLAKSFDGLASFRNDINHGAWRHNACSPDALAKRLNEKYADIREKWAALKKIAG